MLSVVVPTYERPRSLARALESILRQTHLPDEVVVVDNATSAATAAVVRAAANSADLPVRYVREQAPGASSARNRGVAESAGDVIAFLDDDSVAAARWLEALLDAYTTTSGVAAVGGRIELRWPCARPAWVDGLDGYYGTFDLGEERREIDQPLYPYASNLLFERAAFVGVGGFPPELGRRGQSALANEEDGLFRRVAARGLRVLYEPNALVYHRVEGARLTRTWLLRRTFVQGRSDVLVDALFDGSRTRAQRAARAAAALADGAAALRIAAARRRSSPMGPLTRATIHLGSAYEDLRLALGGAPSP
jgi:glycosyltransferase involved in cell wall biosynthesis